MKKESAGLIILVCACSIVMGGALVEQGLAAQKKSKEQAPPGVSENSPTPSPVPARKSTKARTKKSISSTGPKQQAEALRSQAKETPALSKMPRQKGSRKANLSKNIRPKAVVQPRTDLMYHGLLEDTRRYDPRPNYREAGVQNPQTPSLAHDHFLELDHNQDGKIDPIERAFGRLDMDRDLHNRSLQ